MLGYLIKRLLQACVVLLLAVFCVFFLLHVLPGGVARAILGKGATPEQIAVFSRQNHLNEPLPLQYWDYLMQVAHLNLGYSYKLNESVASLLAERIPKTLVLTVLSVVVSLWIAVPMAVLQAARRNRAADFALTGVAFVLYATPVFFSGLLLIMYLAVDLHWLPPEAPQSNSFGGVFSDFQAMVLPILTLALGYVAGFSRYLRSSLIENLAEDYVRVARAKGASETRVLFVHALRNALMPLITFVGLDLPYFIGGAVVVEVLFNFPGMGLLFWNAATSRDYPILLGVTLVVSVAVVVGSLIADLLYAIVDPRVRLKS